MDEMEAITGLHRKSLIQPMNGNLERKLRHRQQSRAYGPEVDDAPSAIAESPDYTRAERLTPKLVWMAKYLDRHCEFETSPPLLFDHHLLCSWNERAQGVPLPRSQPYFKNDNRFVEQKNDERLDTVAQTLTLNRLYNKMRAYCNLFRPTMRLTEKTVFRQEGQPSRVKGRYEPARPSLRTSLHYSRHDPVTPPATRNPTQPNQPTPFATGNLRLDCPPLLFTQHPARLSQRHSPDPDRPLRSTERRGPASHLLFQPHSHSRYQTHP